MTKKLSRIMITFVVLFALSPLSLVAQAFVDIEAGAAFTGYNDVAIPADTGDKVSLASETPAGAIPIFRIRAGYTFADRHTLSVLAAPLTAKGSGKASSDITYQDKVFLAGTDITSIYRFDSYRLTYRWDFLKNEAIDIGIGLTAKIRSADIAFAGDAGYVSRTDLGFVPIINFRLDWRVLTPSLLFSTGMPL